MLKRPFVSGFLHDFARQSWYGKMNSVFTGVSSMKEAQKFACGKGVFLVTWEGRNWDKWCDEVAWNYHVTWQIEVVKQSTFQGTRFFLTLRQLCDEDWWIRISLDFQHVVIIYIPEHFNNDSMILFISTPNVWAQWWNGCLENIKMARYQKYLTFLKLLGPGFFCVFFGLRWDLIFHQVRRCANNGTQAVKAR